MVRCRDGSTAWPVMCTRTRAGRTAMGTNRCSTLPPDSDVGMPVGGKFGDQNVGKPL